MEQMTYLPTRITAFTAVCVIALCIVKPAPAHETQKWVGAPPGGGSCVTICETAKLQMATSGHFMGTDDHWAICRVSADQNRGDKGHGTGQLETDRLQHKAPRPNIRTLQHQRGGI
jgi:hypothetical protein